MHNTLTQRWTRFLAETRYEQLPPEVAHQGKRLVLDCVGCALGGVANEWSAPVLAFGRDLGGRKEATVLGTGERLHPAHAAYVNGKLANLLDFDETLYHTRHIGGSPVFPSLALGERAGASGRDIIVAAVLGYDLAARIAFCGSAFVPDPQHGGLRHGGFASAAFNTLGAGAAAARVLGLDAQGMARTLGLAAYTATGAIEGRFVTTPTSNFHKYGDMGWFCHGGAMAALQARHGYPADEAIFDGPAGLATLTGALAFDHQAFGDRLGERWYVMDAGFKPFPTCRWFGRALVLLQDLLRAHRLQAGDVQEVIVHTHPLALGLPSFTAAFEWDRLERKDYWLVINSLSYAVACVLAGVPAGPQWAARENLESPTLAALARKVKHLEHPQAARLVAQWSGHPGTCFSDPPSSVEVVTAQGRLRLEGTGAPGDEWQPALRLSDDALVAKFEANAAPVLGDAKARRGAQRLMELDAVQDIRVLREVLA
jgi:2-methylcitrate dehydratase PrpD